MDRVATLTLTDTLRRAVAAYAGEVHSVSGTSTLHYLENEQDQVFCVVSPYDPAYKKADLVIMARIVDDKIVIDTDMNLNPLYQVLRDAGVPDEQISVAWKPVRL